jgi:hypothetical protein
MQYGCPWEVFYSDSGNETWDEHNPRDVTCRRWIDWIGYQNAEWCQKMGWVLEENPNEPNPNPSLVRPRSTPDSEEEARERTRAHYEQSGQGNLSGYQQEGRIPRSGEPYH